MKQVKEFISFESGFFSKFAEIEATLFNELFDDITPSNLDMDLVVTCGERYAAPLLIHYDMEKVVSFVINRYADSWKRVKEALTAEYDILSPYDNKRITTQEKTSKTTNTGTVTDKTGVTTFDSEEPVDKSVDSSVNEGETTGDETIKITVENVGTNGNLTFSNLITNELEVRKNSFISLVIGDVENQLTLDIY